MNTVSLLLKQWGLLLFWLPDNIILNLNFIQYIVPPATLTTRINPPRGQDHMDKDNPAYLFITVLVE